MKDTQQRINTPRSSYTKKQNTRRGILLILSLIVILAIVGIIAQKYWPLYVDAVIVFFIIYFAVGIILEKKYLPALTVHCNPYKHYRYLRLCRIPYYFMPFDKSYYKLDLAIGLRNQGKFNEAKKILLSIDIDKFSMPEFLVMYYNNLFDLLIWLKDYSSAHEIADKSFLALEKLTDEMSHEMWLDNLTGNKMLLNMLDEGDTDGCEEFFTASLEKAQNEYSRIESHTNLGIYYLVTKQSEKALVHFEYIAQHGNKLFHVKEARKYIAEIKEQI